MLDSSGYSAALCSAVLLDRSARGKIAVAGADRRSYLHAMLTNDIAPLQPGTGCYAAYLTPQGRMISDMRVLELGDLVLMDLPADQVRPVMEKLDQFVFSEDVKFGDLTEAFAEMTVLGPSAAEVVLAALAAAGGHPAGVTGAGELADWAEFRNVRTSFHGEMVLLVRSQETGVAGFDLYIDRGFAARLAEALTAAGAHPVDESVVEVLRVEAGRPRFGTDLDAETIPLEAGIEGRAISFTKGCYHGQEVVIRIVHRGHGRVAKRLVGLTLDGDVQPEPGSRLRAPDDPARDIGRVTSVVSSPRVGHVIALGYVVRDFAAAGTRVVVEHGGGAIPAAVTAVPFV